MTAPTATQLRNARKRRAKKKNQVSTPSSNSPTSGNRTNSMAVPTSKRLHPSHQEKDDVTSTSSGKRRKRSDQFNSKSNAHSIGKQRNSCVDPSQKYSSHPLQAPIVQRAQQFFHDIFHTARSSPHMMETVTTTTGTGNDRQHHGLCQYPTRNSSTLWNTTSTKFPVYVGSIYGWRTVVKLPVRYSKATTITNRSGSNSNNLGEYHTTSNDGTVPPLITIGLFAPGSHQIVPIVVVENGARRTSCLCQTHHPVINQAIIHIQQTARSLQPHLHHTTKSSSSNTACTHCLTAFSEETGKGYLRHIALSVQRHTNLVQLVLVWNSVPPSSSPSTDRCMGKNDVVDGEVVDSSETVLAQFLEALLQLKSAHDTADNEVNLEWHSIWIHYNNSWKHANAIFSHDGVWKLLYHHSNPSQSTLKADSAIHDKYNHKCPMNGITEYLTTMVENDFSDVDHYKKTCTDTTVVNDKSTIHQLPHVPLHFPPQVFRQGNITAFTNIVQSIRNFIIHQFYGSPNFNDVTRIQHRPSCLELYGGVGTIGLHMVDLCSKFVCSDENPYNVQCFNATVGTVIAAMKEKSGYYPMYDGANKNVEDNLSIPSIRYESASASVMVLDRMEHLNDVDIIIVDPPRKGMDADVCHALTTVLPLLAKTTKNNNSKSKTQAGTNVDDQPLMNEPQQVLIYVSCGFDAFVRDYQILTQVSTTPTSNSQSKTKLKTATPSYSSCNTNPWNLRHAEGHVLFPGSDAIETLAIFTRAKYLPKK